MHYALCFSNLIGRNLFWTNQIARTQCPRVKLGSCGQTGQPSILAHILHIRSPTFLYLKNHGLQSEPPEIRF